MKILFLSSHHGTGASESLWIEAAAKLADSGHDVRAAVNWRKRDLDRLVLLTRRGIRPCFLNPAAIAGRAIKIMRRFMRHDAWELGAARRCLAQSSPDVVVFSEGNDVSALPFMELALSRRIPYQIVTHGVNPSQWPADALADRLRVAFTAAQKTYWVARRNIQEFEHHIGARLPTAAVVHNPVKIDRSAPFAWPAVDSRWKMACVARLQTRAKGHDLLLQAFAAPQWAERNLHLTFFGDGENRRGMESLTRLLGLTNRVTFAGHVGGVQEIWDTHHMIAQPSRNEGMPLSLVEALMCGRPALATDVAGHVELLTDGQNGFIAEAATVSHIGAALERAWSQRQNWEQMGRTAYDRIRSDIPPDPAGDFAAMIVKTATGS
jgi:glycosyltransferase involved in cell wall biosynthesis